jgi:hypothetical protein
VCSKLIFGSKTQRFLGFRFQESGGLDSHPLPLGELRRLVTIYHSKAPAMLVVAAVAAATAAAMLHAMCHHTCPFL